MLASTKSLVVLGVVVSFWSVGCSSKPGGSQPGIATSSPTATVTDVASSPETTGDSLVSAEVSNENNADERAGSKNKPPVIGQLKSRHHTILIHTGSDGPRFTVATLDGSVIAEALSVDEMQAQHPEIYKTYKESFANYEVYLDASSSLDARFLPIGSAPPGR